MLLIVNPIAYFGSSVCISAASLLAEDVHLFAAMPPAASGAKKRQVAASGATEKAPGGRSRNFACKVLHAVLRRQRQGQKKSPSSVIRLPTTTPRDSLTPLNKRRRLPDTSCQTQPAARKRRDRSPPAVEEVRAEPRRVRKHRVRQASAPATGVVVRKRRIPAPPRVPLLPLLPATNPKDAGVAACVAKAASQPAAHKRRGRSPPAVNVEEDPRPLLQPATTPKTQPAARKRRGRSPPAVEEVRAESRPVGKGRRLSPSPAVKDAVAKPAQPAAKDARAKPAQPAARASTDSSGVQLSQKIENAYLVDLDSDLDVLPQAHSPTASLSGNGSSPQASSSSTPTNSPSDSESSTRRKSAPSGASRSPPKMPLAVRLVPARQKRPRQPTPPPVRLVPAIQPKKMPRTSDIQRRPTTVTLQAASGARSWKEQSMGHRVDLVLEEIIRSSDCGPMQACQTTDLVAKHYFLRSKEAQEKVLARAAQGTNGYKLCEMTELDMDRPNTCNYSQKTKLGAHQLKASWESRVQLQLKGKMTQYAGEVRSWPTSRPDKWRLMSVADDHLRSTRVGQFFRGTLIGATIQERVAERVAAGGAQQDPIFSNPLEPGWMAYNNCWPDLDNAISTLAVWDTRQEKINFGTRTVCLREQYGVTLAELFSEFGSTQTYRTIYEEWQKGKLLVRAKPTRGVRGGGTSSWHQ